MRGEDPWAVFERLSVQLNRVTTTPEVHKAFVAKVNRCRADYALHAQMGAMLRHWYEDATTAENLLTFR